MQNIFIILIFISFSLNAQTISSDQPNRKQLVNSVLLLKNKKKKAIGEEVKLNELYQKLGYIKLATNNYIELGKNVRDDNLRRDFFYIADSLNILVSYR